MFDNVIKILAIWVHVFIKYFLLFNFFVVYIFVYSACFGLKGELEFAISLILQGQARTSVG